MISESRTFKPAALRYCLLVFAVLCFAKAASAQEFRAAWADVFHVGMGSTTEVNNMVSALVTGHYNAVVVQVVAYMDSGSSSHGALYKSSILPWSTRVTSSFDPLAYLCAQAHANGIEVHAWLGGSAGAMYRVSTSWPPAGNSTLANHPQWFIAPLANSEGGSPVLVDGNYDLDMGSPDAQEYIVSLVKELVTNYPIDGINWDDELNGAGYTAGFGYPAWSQANYAKSGLARYRINTGYVGTPSNTDTAWSNYRRRFKNELMARVQAEIQSIKTNPRQPVRHTSAALAYSPVPSTCDFTGSTPYTYFCDWPGMLQNGWMDAIIPQTYSSSTFSNWVDRIAACWQYNRQVFPGIGGYLQTDATIAGEITYTRSKGLKGNCIYSYAVPNSAGNSDWWAYAAATVYTNVVSTPSMPWRNPATATEGIMWGRVQDGATSLYVDDATVTVTGGPTVKTDGNGYYIAALVPATAGGTVHSTTASKSGATSQTIANATVLAGDIVRYDFTLNGATAPAITNQPQSQTVNQGANATFTVGATGTAPLAYQWRFYATNLAGATASSYTRVSAQAADAGSYSVVVTNSAGSVTSVDAVLTVNVQLAPPNIITQPQSQTVGQGTNATFTVTASGSTPLYYQWLFYGTNLSGATGSAYTRLNPQPADGGPYSVIVSNSIATTNSSSATLTVIVPPSLTTQPQSQTVAQGANVTFTAAATGTSPFGYQWRFNSANISGATASSYSRNSVQLADAGSYSIVVSNFAGTATSTNAVLTVNAPPSITTQPQSQAVNQGGSALLSVAATGTAPLAYQWRFYSTNLPGATATSLPLSGVSTNEAGPYTAVVTNNFGAATSQVATLTVSPYFQVGGVSLLWSLPPYSRSYLTTNSLPYERGLSYNPAANHLLFVSRNGPHVYVLDANNGADVNELNVSGVSGGTYALLMVGVADDGAVYAGNLTTASTSTPFTVYRWANDGSSTVPTVAYSGNPSPGNSQRYGDTLDVRGAGANTQLIVGSRNYNNAVILTTTDGSTFAATNITVADSPASSFGLGIAFGQSTTFWGKASSVPLRQVSYNLSAGTGSSSHVYADPAVPNPVSPIGVSASLNLLAGIYTGVSNNHLRLYDLSPVATNGNPLLIATNLFGSDNDNSGTYSGSVDFSTSRIYALCGNNGIIALQLTPAAVAPAIVAQPQDQTVSQGDTASFTVAATGFPAPAYQWRLNGTGISGATQSTYSRGNAQTNDAGSYSVVVTNTAGSIASSNAVLAVNVPPGISSQPQSQTVNQGGSALFTVVASGIPAPAYQWRFNGADIAGATLSAYSRGNVQTNDAGSYSVLLTNAAGILPSADAVLTVNVSPSITTPPMSVSTNAGANISFAVNASGTSPFGYQWRFNGMGISGATDTAYVRTSVQPADAGSFSVVVTNMVGAATSADAVLSVVLPHIEAIQLLSAQGFQLQLSGGPGHFAIETTPDLAVWSQLATLTATNAAFEFLDPDLTQTNRFYRVKGLP